MFTKLLLLKKRTHTQTRNINKWNHRIKKAQCEQYATKRIKWLPNTHIQKSCTSGALQCFDLAVYGLDWEYLKLAKWTIERDARAMPCGPVCTVYHTESDKEIETSGKRRRQKSVNIAHQQQHYLSCSKLFLITHTHTHCEKESFVFRKYIYKKRGEKNKWLKNACDRNGRPQLIRIQLKNKYFRCLEAKIFWGNNEIVFILKTKIFWICWSNASTRNEQFYKSIKCIQFGRYTNYQTNLK